jgi:hypothetical protein
MTTASWRLRSMLCCKGHANCFLMISESKAAAAAPRRLTASLDTAFTACKERCWGSCQLQDSPTAPGLAHGARSSCNCAVQEAPPRRLGARAQVQGLWGRLPARSGGAADGAARAGGPAAAARPGARQGRRSGRWSCGRPRHRAACGGRCCGRGGCGTRRVARPGALVRELHKVGEYCGALQAFATPHRTATVVGAPTEHVQGLRLALYSKRAAAMPAVAGPCVSVYRGCVAALGVPQRPADRVLRPCL